MGAGASGLDLTGLRVTAGFLPSSDHVAWVALQQHLVLWRPSLQPGVEVVALRLLSTLVFPEGRAHFYINWHQRVTQIARYTQIRRLPLACNQPC